MCHIGVCTIHMFVYIQAFRNQLYKDALKISSVQYNTIFMVFLLLLSWNKSEKQYQVQDFALKNIIIAKIFIFLSTCKQLQLRRRQFSFF